MGKNTEEKILEAAREVFTQKGYAAARMQEIADRAQINKGLLHYYFKRKDKLFRAIFEEAFRTFGKGFNSLLDADRPLFDTIEAIVNSYFDLLLSNPGLPAFVINELNRNPEVFVKELLGMENRPDPARFLMKVQLAVDAGRIRPVNPFHLLMNIMSLCAFPFAARPMFQGLVGIDQGTYMQFMEQRRSLVVDFVIAAIKPENINQTGNS